MKYYLNQLKHISETLNGDFDLPIICCGDVFDKWQSPPELVNFLLGNMPKMYSIPGNHDLPYHNYSNIQQSAYWTLVEAGVITTMTPACSTRIRINHETSLRIWAFPTGSPVTPLDMDLVDSLNTKELEKGEVAFDIAVVHEYLWTEGMGFPGSPEQFHINVVQKNLDGYDAAFFGDNHHFFHTQFDVGCPHVMNVGTFMRRRSTERGYSPRYGIIYDNGHVASKRFHTRSDVMIDTTPKVSLPNDITVKSLLEYLKAVDSEDMDFRSTLIAHIKKPTTRISERAKQIIFAILEEC